MTNRQSTNVNSFWLLVTLYVSRAAEETASALLFDLGSTGVITLEETADSVKLGGYFNEQTNANDILQAVEVEFARVELCNALHSVEVATVLDQDWMQKWKEGFEAVEIGERLVVGPSWKLPEKSKDRVTVQIDPGMAFGTGTHETTRLCLEAIERHWRGGALLDVGSGTGILAIAAALLAPGSRVVAIDIDPEAVKVARENLSINCVSDLVELREGAPHSLAAQQFNVVVANLTAEVIVELINDIARCIAARGLMILSGILTPLADDVERALKGSGFEVFERREAGEWSALVAVKS